MARVRYRLVVLRWAIKMRNSSIWQRLENVLAIEILSFGVIFGFAMAFLEWHRFMPAIVLFSIGCIVLAWRIILFCFKLRNVFGRYALIVVVYIGAIIGDLYLMSIVRDVQEEYAESGMRGVVESRHLPRQDATARRPTSSSDSQADTKTAHHSALSTPSNPLQTPTPEPASCTTKVGSGPNPYESVCNQTLTKWARDEADKIDGMANELLDRLDKASVYGANAESKRNGDRGYFTFSYHTCCMQTVHQLRNELVSRAGPASDEPMADFFLTQTETQWSKGNDIALGDVNEVAAYLRRLADKVDKLKS